MSNYPYNQPPPYPGGPPPPQPPSNKNSKILMWSLIGCGALIVIGAIIVVAGGYFIVNKAKEMGFDPELMEKQPTLAVGKIIASTNPDVELVSVDEEKKLITLKEKSTGKVITISLEDAQAGKIVFQEDGKDKVTIEAKGDSGSGGVEIKTDEGNARFRTGGTASVPDWMPEYPGVEVTGNFSITNDKTDTGSFSFTTGDSIEDVVRFYEDGLKQAGFNVSASFMREGGKVKYGTVGGEDSERKRTVSISAQADGSDVRVTVAYEIKK